MRHYVAILLHSTRGTWRGFVPDIPDLYVEGAGFTKTTREIAARLVRCAEAHDGDLPLPRDLIEIERDEEWLTRNGVDLAQAIVTIVPWHGDLFGGIRGHG